jgi:hypothetical protein
VSAEHGSARTIGVSEVTIRPGSAWSRLPGLGLVLAGIGLGGAFYLGRGAPRQLYHSYLVAYLFFLSLALGALFFVLVQHATRSGWSVVVRRIAEHVAGTLVVFVPLFAPIAIGLHDLYHWSHADAVASDHLLHHKQPYLNATFFFIRAAAYLGIWTVLGLWFRRRSLAQDASGDHEITRKLGRASAPGLILFGLSITFASFDWVMSLDPHWYSTIYGVVFFAGSVVGFFAVVALLALGLGRSGLTAGAITTEHLHDVSRLLFAFICFWAYVAFSQFMLYWYANIPEETTFYLTRMGPGWQRVSILIAVGHFVAPFFFLLPRTVKRSRAGLALAAVWMLAMHYLDLYWLVMPILHPAGFQPSLLDGATLLGVGGAFLAALGRLLQGAPLIPVRDPRLPESLSFENY